MSAVQQPDARLAKDRIRGEQVRALMRNCPIGVVAASLVAIMLSVTLEGRAETSLLFVRYWSLFVIVGMAAHLLLCFVYWRTQPADSTWRLWIGAFTLIAFLEGLSWCLGAVWLDRSDDMLQVVVVVLASAGVAAGGIIVFGPYMPTYLLFFVPAIAPHLVVAIRNPYPFQTTLVSLIAMFLIFVPLTAWRFNVQFVEGLRLRFANLDLAEDLRRQKDVAEQASRAKSSFLAAASHDLRQPIHALSLFIGALRSRKMDGEARRLVDRIDGSVSAMDDLFASLLDISKLDAGGIEAQHEAVEIGPLIERLCRDHAGEAAAKGIALRYANASATVLSDPFLLERILRNLLSNAVRYTSAGGVLVGIRSRRDQVCVEVWDTGCGIAPEQQDRIFDEFYQVGNPERDRSRGLGLGLAIVRRVAAIIDVPLSFSSRVGRGSVFRLLLPRTTLLPARPDAGVRHGHDRRNALIFVVDDEVAIQHGMASLLESWGHRAIVAGSGDEMLAHARQCAEPPDLIICDYRLRGAETGTVVVARLVDHFGLAIPAMLITGDTAPDRINEARASGHVLLTKPVSNSKLRAAIGNLMRAKPGTR